MLTLNDGRSDLWQWDTGRILTVDSDCSQVHFSNKVFGRSIDVDVVDGAAIIPDVLLQTDKDLNAWAFVGTAENGYTKISKTFKVNRRNKPADYVFTPTDQTTLDDILDRIEDLEKRPSGGSGGITKEVDPTVPDWAKQPQKPTYTAADVGAIPVPKTATVGQTIVVKAVDEAGKPTEWEAADMPSGGGSSLPATGVEDAGKVLTVTEAGVPGWAINPAAYDTWESIADFTLGEDATSVNIHLGGIAWRKIIFYIYQPVLPDVDAWCGLVFGRTSLNGAALVANGTGIKNKSISIAIELPSPYADACMLDTTTNLRKKIGKIGALRYDDVFRLKSNGGSYITTITNTATASTDYIMFPDNFDDVYPYPDSYIKFGGNGGVELTSPLKVGTRVQLLGVR